MNNALMSFVGLAVASSIAFAAPVMANLLGGNGSLGTQYVRNRPHPILLAASTTPDSSVEITKGPLKETKVAYSDPRGKHTKFPKYTQADLEKALKSPSSAEQKFADAVKAKDNSYGGQLNSDAIVGYAALVKDAVENGISVPNKGSEYYHEAAFVVGIDIGTGKGTKKYQVVSVPNGTHIFPYEYTKTDLKK
jgi:hypothetical protein